MTTLITGANGFVGSSLLRILLDEGHDVRVFVRPGSDRRNLHGLNIEIFEGDLIDTNSLQNAVKNCNALFHVAADYRLWIPDPEIMYRTNVEGTKQLMLAALNEGVERIVYTSSVATLGLNTDGTPANETTPVTVDNMVGHYKRSKFLAEQNVHHLISTQKLPAVIVNPSTPVGPRDIKPTPTGRIILDTIRNRMPAYVDTGLNIAHVDDVAKGHLLAFEKGVIGERYILGGDNMTLKEILEFICKYINVAPPRIRLPHNLILPVAWIMERISNISGKEPRATVDGVKMSKKIMFFSSAKAESSLGYEARPGTEGLIGAINWFNENNYK